LAAWLCGWLTLYKLNASAFIPAPLLGSFLLIPDVCHLVAVVNQISCFDYRINKTLGPTAKVGVIVNQSLADAGYRDRPFTGGLWYALFCSL
jgi:hypothetical protein